MMRRVILALVVFGVAMTAASAQEKPEFQRKPVVGLDYYYNHELRDGQQYNYTWEDTGNTGYSKFGELVRQLGGEVDVVWSAATAKSLKPVNVYIITDPDTPKESPDPHYIQPADIKAIVDWVKKGGTLVLMGNGAGEAEFEHFNQLAGQFGIQFNADTRKNSMEAEKLLLTDLPNHPIFQGVKKGLYIKGMSTLKVEPPAETIYTFQGDALMAVARLGKGRVFAVGDPWVYNEYIDRADNRPAATNLLRWLMER